MFWNYRDGAILEDPIRFR